MALKTYLISEYSHKAETLQFESLSSVLEKLYKDKDEECILIGNYNIEGVELDGLLISERAVIVLEFKNWGGNINAAENGQWTSNGKTIAGGAYGKSPFMQARLNRSKTRQGLERFLQREIKEIGVLVIFWQPASIDDSGLSDTVKKWLCTSDNEHLSENISTRLQGAQKFNSDFVRHIPELLKISQFETRLNSLSTSGPGYVRYVPDVSTDFFERISDLPDTLDIRDKYRYLSEIFHQAVEGKLQNNTTKFSGFFAKMNFLLMEYREKFIDRTIPSSINGLRTRILRLNPPKTYGNESPAKISDEELQKSIDHDIAALCKFIGIIYDSPVPNELNRRYPYISTSFIRPLYHKGDVVRVIIRNWDDSFIYAVNCISGEECKVCYRDDNNEYSNGDRSYLKDILLSGEQLNLIRPRIENDILYPEIIIFNPDYLIDVSTLAGCFTENEHTSPYAYLIKKLSPSINNTAITLGNFSGQLLDEEVYRMERSFENSFKSFCSKNSINLAVTPLSDDFRQQAEAQKLHIQNAIRHSIKKDSTISSFREGGKGTILEPSFFSETLGLQARMDLIQMDKSLLIEQKSGRAGYNPMDPENPKKRADHFVQALLYRAIFRYNYNKKNDSFDSFLLYTKYPNSLLRIDSAPKLLFEALKLRNRIAWLELLLTKGGFRILDSLKPENIYPGENGPLWDRYVRPQLQNMLDIIQHSNQLEKDYYYRFLTFIENEQILSKVGNRTKEDSGFASIWNSSLEDRLEAGNIYAGLSLVYKEKNDDNQIEVVQFDFSKQQEKDQSNFRIGDIVFFYSYNPNEDEEPLATRHNVFRGSIIERDSASVKVSLRNPQTDPGVFEGDVWAIEHDFMESSYRSLFQGMQLFLSATQKRKDLLLLQRKPEIDLSLDIKGDYTVHETGNTEFNNLVLRVKQAKDLFLIIGPPGTGKTSFGMVNILKEQLLEENSSILLLSFTNRAVDEMCSKLVEENIPFIRLGSELGCEKKYRGHLLNKVAEQCSDGYEIQQLIKSCRVFCGTTTAFNSNNSLLNIKQFDLAIVDEASQILEPQIVGLLSAKYNDEDSIKKFVLIGDEKQLPAVVQQQVSESQVTEPNLQEINLIDCRLSLFERLLRTFRKDNKDNEYSYMLTRQGRMHSDIALFPNYSFYQNKLRAVPRTHQIEDTPIKYNSSNGLINLLHTRRVSFITYPQPEKVNWEHEASDKVNLTEAKMIAATVKQIYDLDPAHFNDKKTVGVIVPYRNQISTVKNEIETYGIPELLDITIDTVERYQGSQRENIIYGFTLKKYYQLNFLTNNQYIDRTSGDIIDRKLNVAMTRAMKHLIMIGNARLLRENIIFFKLMEFAKSRQSYFEISPESFVKGDFIVSDVNFMSNELFKDITYKIDDDFAKAFNSHVLQPIKNDPDTIWPTFILGNRYATNKELIDYGRINFSSAKMMYQLDRKDDQNKPMYRTFDVKDQVLIYCYTIMRSHYCSAKAIYDSYKSWIEAKITANPNNLRFIDIGCGPATCGLAFMNTFKNTIEHMDYYGIDVSAGMHEMAAKLMNDSHGNKVYFHKKTSFGQLDNSFWKSVSASPSLVIFNMSYFFSNVGPEFAENLAKQILTVIENQNVNKFIFFIQHSEGDNSIKSFQVFKKVLSPHCIKHKHEKSLFTYQLNSEAKSLPFCFDIWEK